MAIIENRLKHAIRNYSLGSELLLDFQQYKLSQRKLYLKNDQKWANKDKWNIWFDAKDIIGEHF